MIVKGVKISELELRNELTGKENIPFQDSFSNGKLNLEGVIDYFQKVTNQNISLQSLVNIKQCIQSASELEFYASNVGDVYFNTGDKKLYMYQEDGTYAISDPSKTQLYVFLTPLDSEKSDAIYRWDENSKQFIVPSYVDDVIEVYATYDVSPIGQLNNIKLYKDAKHTQAVVGEVGKIYINIEEGQPAYSFRWSGSIWVSVNDGGPLIIGEITGTAYDGGKGKHNKDIIDSLPDTVLSNVSSTVEKTGTTNKINVNNKKRGSDELYVDNTDSSVILDSSTDTEAGLMAAADKKLFDSMPNMWLTEQSTITASADKVIVAQSISRVQDGVYKQSGDLYRDIPAATTTTAGVMTAADKVRLDTGVAEDIQAEREAREAADRQLQSNIDAEASTRSQADTALGNRITTESSDREAADTALGGRIDKEITDRGDAIDAVTDKINTEISDRKAAITAEETARTQADEALRTDLNAEVTRAKNAENNITANYQSADSAINTRISTEIADRKQADTELQQAISAETTRATGKEAELSTAISTETSERQKGDQDNNTRITEVSNQLNGFIATKGQPNGFASLDGKGLIPSSQLPAYVDDVIEVATFNELPEVGEAGKIYVTLDTNLTYRWSGTRYIEISQSLALGETSSTAYAGDKGKYLKDVSDSLPSDIITSINYLPSTNYVNIMGNKKTKGEDGIYIDADQAIVTIGAASSTFAGVMTIADKVKLDGLKTQEGITSDIDSVQSNLTTHITNKQNPHSVTKAQVGLGNVDNTADTDKPISTATQTALDAKFSLTEGNSLKTTADSLPDRIIAYIPGSSIDATGETVSITEGTQYVDKSNGVYGSLKQSSVTKTLTAATTTKAGVLTAADKVKIDKITTDGDGTRYLADNGTYKLIQGGGSGDSGTFVLETAAADQLTDTEYNDLKDAIEANKIIIADLGLTLGTIAQIYQPCFAATYDSSSNKIVLSLTQTTGTVSSSEDTRRLVVCDIIISGSADHTVGRDNYNLVNENMVLTFGNTKEYTPTTVYSPATKKYVDEQMFLLTISDTGYQELVSNQDTTGETAATKINTVFGSADNFKSVVSQLMANKRLVIKIMETERFQPGVIQSYMNTDDGAYELSFDFNYSSLSSTGATLLSKRILIAMNNNYGNFFIVRDIVTSDNLTTLTKKSTEEYAAITNKDANTVYYVTD